jgi:glycosyltransferase involved in cell wall biosynthesis
MAGGRPTLLAIDGVIRDVIESANGGWFVPPGKEQAIADAILYLYNHPQECKGMGESARNYVVNNFDRSQQGIAFVSLIKKLAE